MSKDRGRKAVNKDIVMAKEKAQKRELKRARAHEIKLRRVS